MCFRKDNKIANPACTKLCKTCVLHQLEALYVSAFLVEKELRCNLPLSGLMVCR